MYKKQIILSEIGIAGQKILFSSKILCVGLGGLGSSALIYLFLCGIGTIGIVEMDEVELSNLHRQPLYNIKDIGKKKIDCAFNFLKKLNPNINIIKFYYKLSYDNAYDTFKNFEIVLDCTDNIETKFLINYFAYTLKIPMVYGSALGFEGHVAIFDASISSCFKCLNRNNFSSIENCDQNGVIGFIPGIIGLFQSLECVKLILYKNNVGNFKPLIGKILIFNGVDFNIKIYNLKKYNHCDVCSKLPENIFIYDSVFNISYEDLKKNYKNIYFFDIREKYIYNYNHLIGSMNISFYFFDSFVPLLFQRLFYYVNIVVYCETEIKSLIICKLLKKYSFFNVFSFKSKLFYVCK